MECTKEVIEEGYDTSNPYVIDYTLAPRYNSTIFPPFLENQCISYEAFGTIGYF